MLEFEISQNSSTTEDPEEIVFLFSSSKNIQIPKDKKYI